MAYPSSLIWTSTNSLPETKYFDQTFLGTLDSFREDKVPFEDSDTCSEYKLKTDVYKFYSLSARSLNGLTVIGTTEEDSCINLITGEISNDTYKISMLLWGLIDGSKSYLYNYDFMIMQATGFINLLKSKGISSIQTTTKEPSKNTKYFHEEWPGLELFSSIEIINKLPINEQSHYAVRHFKFL